jgi:hypothetical protein
MEDRDARYEVLFALDSVASRDPRGTFCWSWVQIRPDGLVSVRGKIYPSLSAALDAAAEYRRAHGGGAIRVNIGETQHQDAQDAIHLS